MARDRFYILTIKAHVIFPTPATNFLTKDLRSKGRTPYIFQGLLSYQRKVCYYCECMNLFSLCRYNFTFPLSYPVNDNNWHVATIVLLPDAKLSFYLDGVMRESPKLTKGIPGSSLYYIKSGTVYIGYFKVRLNFPKLC